MLRDRLRPATDAWVRRCSPCRSDSRSGFSSGSAAAAAPSSLSGMPTGFFGVGGGFLIVPALVLLLGPPITLAVGTSLAVIALTSAALLGRRLGGRFESTQTHLALRGNAGGSRDPHRDRVRSRVQLRCAAPASSSRRWKSRRSSFRSSALRARSSSARSRRNQLSNVRRSGTLSSSKAQWPSKEVPPGCQRGQRSSGHPPTRLATYCRRQRSSSRAEDGFITRRSSLRRATRTSAGTPISLRATTHSRALTSQGAVRCPRKVPGRVSPSPR